MDAGEGGDSKTLTFMFVRALVAEKCYVAHKTSFPTEVTGKFLVHNIIRRGSWRLILCIYVQRKTRAIHRGRNHHDW
jgi:hypothetical protein